jgi:translation initiation factor IF-3
VEVAPTAQPPVCKLLDYGKYRYEQTKKEREARKSQKIISVKEIRLRPKIDEHDFLTKAKAAERFLAEGNKVKLTVLFRGREQAHLELGQELLDRMVAELAQVAQVEQAAKSEGRTLTLVLAPSRTSRKASEKAMAKPVAP